MDPLKPFKLAAEEVKDVASDVSHAPADAFVGIEQWVKRERISAEILVLTKLRDGIAAAFNSQIAALQQELEP